MEVRSHSWYRHTATTVTLCLASLFWLGVSSEVQAQGPNIVINPSFEFFNPCIWGISSITSDELKKLPGWTTPTDATPDAYFEDNILCQPHQPCPGGASANGTTVPAAGVPNNYSGQESPKHGHAYAGIYYDLDNSGWFEYLRGTTGTALVQGQWYEVSFSASLAEWSTIALRNIGAIIGTDLPSRKLQPVSANYGPYRRGATEEVPDIVSSDFILDRGDLDDWTEVKGYYRAQGGENSFIIGCFESIPIRTGLSTLPLVCPPNVTTRENEAYYYIDSVSISSVEICECSTTDENVQWVPRLVPVEPTESGCCYALYLKNSSDCIVGNSPGGVYTELTDPSNVYLDIEPESVTAGDWDVHAVNFGTRLCLINS